MGKVDAVESGSDITITLNANNADIIVGGAGQDGGIKVRDQTGKLRSYVAAADLHVGGNGQSGALRIHPANSNLIFPGDIAVPGPTYTTILLDGDGSIHLDSPGGDNTATLNPRTINLMANKKSRIFLDSADANIYLGGNGMGGDILLYPAGGNFLGGPTTAPSLSLSGDNGSVVAKPTSGAGAVVVKNDFGDEVLRLDIVHSPLPDGDQIGASGGGRIVLKNELLKETLILDGQQGDIVLNQADCAEEFDVSPDVGVEPGTVVVLDEEGRLRPSDEPYDHRVAGVVSGAGDFKPAILLDKKDQRGSRLPISLTGKVYCKTDAQYAEIKAGDLLTTSPTVGHAMKALDSARAFGAVIGKAMRPLSGGQGLIPILIALQ
jgi:hypothetical protein